MKDKIKQVCEEICAMLLKKNESYGNSAAEPVRIFSKVDAIQQINVRIDDKLSRIAKGKEFYGEDTELDLIGYLILKRAISTQKEPGRQGDKPAKTCPPCYGQYNTIYSKPCALCEWSSICIRVS